MLRFSNVDLGNKSADQKVKDYRKSLAEQIMELCKEFELTSSYHHISDLVRKLQEE
jgi:hypothetical protein